jgi:hypothetical protein
MQNDTLIACQAHHAGWCLNAEGALSGGHQQEEDSVD